jgi:hypothetical protein
MVSLATFTPKTTLLDECIDLTFPMPSGTDAGASDVADKLAKAFMTDKKNSMSRIYKACGEQFQTTPALATCASHLSLPLAKTDAGSVRTLEIDSQERYYDLDSLTNSNEYMKDCLDMKGDWQASTRARMPTAKPCAPARGERSGRPSRYSGSSCHWSTLRGAYVRRGHCGQLFSVAAMAASVPDERNGRPI